MTAPVLTDMLKETLHTKCHLKRPREQSRTRCISKVLKDVKRGKILDLFIKTMIEVVKHYINNLSHFYS
jgi:hypothetical protein